MKRSKRIYILLGVLAIISVATFGVMQYEERKEQIKNSDEIILELPGDSIQSLSWEYESETLAFHKDEKWLYDEDEAFPVDEEKINGLLEQFQEFGVSFIIEEVEDYGQYGLDEPICTINLSTDEASYEILLGNYSSMDSQRYVSIGDGNVYLVKEDPLDDFNVALSDLILHDKTPLFDKTTAIQFTGSENYSIAYEENSASTYCADDIYFTERNGKNLPLDTTRVNNYLNNISYLNLTDYVTYNVSEEELEAYGLSEPELTVTVDYISEEEEGEEISDTFVLNVSRALEERKAAEESAKESAKEAGEEAAKGVDGESDEDIAEGAEAESDGAIAEGADEESEEEEITAYARVGESQIVYQIASDDYKYLMEASYDSLRHTEVLSADFSDVYQVDISLEGNAYTITSEKEDDERTYYYQDNELDISEFQRTLKNLKANSFTDKQPTEKEEVGLTVYLDNENHPEVQIELYRYDGNNCLAVVDGEPVSLVNRSDAVDFIEAIYAIVLD